MLLRFCGAVASLVLAVANASAADITVGFVTSLSGPGASLGIPYDKGMTAADALIGKIGDTNIKLIRLDDASDPSAASRDARKLVEEDKVDVLIGTSGTPGVIAMAVVGAETKTPMISLTPASAPQSPNGQWMISIPQPPPLMVDAVVARMKKDGVKKVA
jgi:branched-chain amino acid transport system substrate-binding protein